MNKKAVSTIFMTSLLLLCFSSCSNRQEERPSSVIVKTVQASVGADALPKEFPFISNPLRTSELSFRVSGPVDQFEAYTGNFYHKGDIIAGIDPRDFQLRRAHTEAVYQQSKAEYERIKQLYLKQNIPANTYEKAHADHIAAKTAFDKAVNELEDTKLLAPFDGYVGQVYIEKWQDVRASQPVVSFVDISKLRIEIYVTQDIVMQADDLRRVSLSFDTRPDEVFMAEVIEFARTTTPNNLSYLLTAMLPNPGGNLPAGMSGRVFFDLPDTKGVTVSVPQTAICHQPEHGDYLWIVDTTNNTVSRRNVAIGTLQPNGMFSVVDGLMPGEIVATSSLRFLSDGMTVKLDDTIKGHAGLNPKHKDISK